MARSEAPARPDATTDYCGSKWAHKAHSWYDLESRKRECQGSTTAEKPNKRDARNQES